MSSKSTKADMKISAFVLMAVSVLNSLFGDESDG
jgi:hypothetical protein